MNVTTIVSVIKYILILSIIASIVGLATALSLAKEELATKKAELAVVGATLDKQNQTVKALQLDVEKYKNKKPQIIEKIITKYQDIEIKDETCEAYMKAINENHHKFMKGLKK